MAEHLEARCGSTFGAIGEPPALDPKRQFVWMPSENLEFANWYAQIITPKQHLTVFVVCTKEQVLAETSRDPLGNSWWAGERHREIEVFMRPRREMA